MAQIVGVLHQQVDRPFALLYKQAANVKRREASQSQSRKIGSLPFVCTLPET